MDMILVWLLIVPLIGGVLAWLAAGRSAGAARWISLLALTIDLGLGLVLWFASSPSLSPTPGPWIATVAASWIPRFGIDFRLGMDGLSLLMVLLSVFLGIVSVAASWREIDERVGFFHFNLLWTIAGTIGVFLALDLFLFFFFWEVMLVPMYFLIAIWGHERRVYAAIKFFIFTQGSGLLMLVAILGLVFAHHTATGNYTFNYFALLGTPLSARTAMWLMLGFFVAFAVKLPAVPLHTWLPDAHTEAPTAGSVLLAGILLKTGAYGLLRFVGPLFPHAAMAFAPVAMWLGVAGIVYGAWVAFAQDDFKRLVAYTSISHLGFVLLGVFAFNQYALQGTVMQMIAHGLSTGALFILSGMLQERLHTRDMRRMGGFWSHAPQMGALAMFFAMASLGLPALANFVGEFLVLLGSWRVAELPTAIAALGLVFATIYSLILIQRSFHGEPRPGPVLADVNGREFATLLGMALLIVVLGLRPAPVLHTADAALSSLQTMVIGGAAR